MKNNLNPSILKRILFYLIFPMLCMLLAAGCGSKKTKVYSHEQFERSILPGNTYVILGQEIGQGNIERVSFALHFNGYANAKSKGVQTPEAKNITLKATDQIDFVITDRSKHAYRIWEIPFDDVQTNGRAMLFCQMFSKHDFTWMPQSKTRIGRNNSWMAPIEYGKENYFHGIAFTLVKPGIYYLGETVISGRLFEDKETDNIRTSIENYRLGVRSNPEKAKSHLKSLRIEPSSFFDLSREWKELSWNDLGKYKKADSSVYYYAP